MLPTEITVDWLLVVVVALATVWGFLWYRTRRRPVEEPPAFRDPRAERARELLTAAAAADREGNWREAQRARLEATWLRVDPPFGQQDPPLTLDPNEISHLRLADEIRQRYAATLADKDHPHADCTFQPIARLPFPKEDISRTLELLMAIGQGEISSAHVGPDALSENDLAVVKRSRQMLETFIDVSPHDLPTDPDTNLAVGQEQRSSS